MGLGCEADGDGSCFVVNGTTFSPRPAERGLVDTINRAFAAGDVQGAVRAIRSEARSRGMTRLSKATGLNRENLYRILADDSNPKVGTFLRILKNYGLRLSVQNTQD